MSDKTWRKRALVVAAGVGVSAVVLAGCTSPGGTDGGDAAPAVVDTQIILAETNETTSFNPATPQSNLDINGKLWYATHETFAYINDQMEVVPNEAFGTMEKVSDDPLTVEYTISDRAQWSDGTPITTDDLLLGWAIGSGYYDDATLDEEGDGHRRHAVLHHRRVDRAVSKTPRSPRSARTRSRLTLVYDTPFVDWNLQSAARPGREPVPIHVVAEKAGVDRRGVHRGTRDAPREVTPPLPPSRTRPSRRSADFWNTGFDVTSMPDDESLYLSNGPFIVDSWEPTQSMTLKINENYKGDHKPAYSNLVFRFVGDSQAQVTALQNGEVDIINPQAGGDTLAAAREHRGHPDPHRSSAVLRPRRPVATAGDWADPAVREAFMKIIPRQQIVDTVVKPINPDAEVLNSQIYVTSQTEPYEKTIADRTDRTPTPRSTSRAPRSCSPVAPRRRASSTTSTTRTASRRSRPSRPRRPRPASSSRTSAARTGARSCRATSTTCRSSAGSRPVSATRSIPQIFASDGGSNFTGARIPEVDELAARHPG